MEDLHLKKEVTQQMQLRNNRRKENSGEMKARVDTSRSIQIGLSQCFGNGIPLKFWLLIYSHFRLTDKNHYRSDCLSELGNNRRENI